MSEFGYQAKSTQLPLFSMILPRNLLSIFIVYQQTLVALGQEMYLADALAHASGHMLWRLKEILDFRPVEEACGRYRHSRGPGCPASYSISMLVRAILVGWLYGLSLRKLEGRLHYDLVARWFVGCGAGERIPDHSTLGRFELWLIETQAEVYFSTLLSQIDRFFPQERQSVQIGDTYAMLANAADEGLVKRIRHLCLRLSMELQDSLPGKFEIYLQGFPWQALFGPKPEKAEELIGKAGRKERLERTVLAALDFRQRVERLLETDDRYEQRLLWSWCAYLDKVLKDEVEVERNAQNEPVRVTEKAMKNKGDFRVISATDPEASLRMHGDRDQLRLGYNVQLAITPTGFIRETRAYSGATPDQSGVAALIAAQKQRQEATGQSPQLPPKLIYDKAAGTGKTRAEVQAVSHGHTQLVAKAKQPFTQAEHFSPYDFHLAPDGESLTCPHGQVSTTAYPVPESYARHFAFHPHQCWQGQPPHSQKQADLSKRCPVWEHCRGANQGPRRIRQVFISDFRDQILAAEVYNQTESFQKEMKQRPLVERVIFELTHYHGARLCRRRGVLGADFQAKMCATAYNLKLLLLKLGRVAPKPGIAPLAG